MGLLLCELPLRVAAYLSYRGTLTYYQQLPPDPLPGSRVRLGQLIRRSPHRRLVYELRPGLRVIYENGLVTTTASGFRGKERQEAKSPGVLRIVGLGDSFMFGQGVHDEETHLARLEDKLNDGLTRHETLNLGVPGYNAAMEVEALKLKGLRFHPDLVLIEFLGNDIDLPNFIRADPEVLRLRKFFLLDFARDRLSSEALPDGADRGLAEAPRRADDAELFERDPSAVPAPYRDLVGWAAVEAAYHQLSQLSKERGFGIALLHWQSSLTEPRLLRLARQIGIPTLNLSVAADHYVRSHGYSSWENSPLVLGNGDNHPSALGHQITSEAVVQFLKQRHLVPAHRD